MSRTKSYFMEKYGDDASNWPILDNIQEQQEHEFVVTTINTNLQQHVVKIVNSEQEKLDSGTPF